MEIDYAQVGLIELKWTRDWNVIMGMQPLRVVMKLYKRKKNRGRSKIDFIILRLTSPCHYVVELDILQNTTDKNRFSGVRWHVNYISNKNRNIIKRTGTRDPFLTFGGQKQVVTFSYVNNVQTQLQSPFLVRKYTLIPNASIFCNFIVMSWGQTED